MFYFVLGRRRGVTSTPIPWLVVGGGGDGHVGPSYSRALMPTRCLSSHGLHGDVVGYLPR